MQLPTSQAVCVANRHLIKCGKDEVISQSSCVVILNLKETVLAVSNVKYVGSGKAKHHQTLH